jgi:hypothetical protein
MSVTAAALHMDEWMSFNVNKELGQQQTYKNNRKSIPTFPESKYTLAYVGKLIRPKKRLYIGIFTEAASIGTSIYFNYSRLLIS